LRENWGIAADCLTGPSSCAGADWFTLKVQTRRICDSNAQAIITYAHEMYLDNAANISAAEHQVS
jgi:hypothetical protein